MENLTIRLKKTNNPFSWINQNIGQVVTAKKDWFDEYKRRYVYFVDFKENPHLIHIQDGVGGYVELNEAEAI